MVLGMSIGRFLLILSLSVSPLAVLVLRPHRMGGGFWRNLLRIARDHWPQVGVLGFLYMTKSYVDTLNDPVRGVFGDFTYLVYGLEGDFVLWVQEAFYHPWLTEVLNYNYLFGYIFLTYFSFILVSYAGHGRLATRMVLNVLIIYTLAVPFYVFFNVQVTSNYIPGMESLLYHDSAAFLSFFAAVDPLDNAWPSLHIGIPFGFLVLFFWRTQRDGHRLTEAPYGPYMAVIAAQIAVFTFSIVYLGVHWVLDIPGGLLIGYLGAIVVDEIAPDVHWALMRIRGVVNGTAADLWARLVDALLA
jgi:membrane-associated phospholipid phosphatase